MMLDSTAAALGVDWASMEYCAPPPTALYRWDYVWQRQFGADEALFVDGSGLRGRRAGLANCGGDETAMRPMLGGDLVSRAGVDGCDVTLSSVTVDEVWSHRGVKRVTVEARLLGENSFARDVLFRASGSVGAPISRRGGAALGSAHLSASRNRGIELAVSSRRGILCLSRRRTIATKTFNPMQQRGVVGGGGPPSSATPTTVVMPKVTYTDPKITVAFHVQVCLTLTVYASGFLPGFRGN